MGIGALVREPAAAAVAVAIKAEITVPIALAISAGVKQLPPLLPLHLPWTAAIANNVAAAVAAASTEIAGRRQTCSFMLQLHCIA